jgi:hypothetical protein
MSQLEVIRHQPNFPNEDLEDANVSIMEFFLQERTEALSHARYIKETFRPIHQSAHYALQQAGVEVDYTPAEYEAFCKGFAAFEYVSLMVNPRYIREQLIVKNVHRLLTSIEAIPEIELADGREAWMETYPNMNDVLIDAGTRDGETMAQLHSRTMGAQIACEMQRAA